MKVIFLDISGVLDPIGWSGKGFDPGAILEVNRIVRLTGASIVLSSDWVADPFSFPWACELLEAGGLCGRIVGRTEQPFGQSILHRPHQIRTWLDGNPAVTHYVILDDMPLPVGSHREDLDEEELNEIPDIPDMEEHFVRIDGFKGVVHEDVRRAVEILRSP